MPFIDRGFARLAEGLVHYRHVEAAVDGVPLVLLHASPGSSRGLEPLLAALAATGGAPRLLAPDTLGHGESVIAAPDAPDIAYYADSLGRFLDAIGVEKVVLYGAHTGARIACEAAILLPGRVTQIILDGIADYEEPLRSELLESYAPEMAPDEYGRHLVWAFNFVRDQALHFPYYRRTPAQRLMSRAVPDADELHLASLDVLKAIRTYHKAYRAAFRYPTRERLALVPCPVALLDMTTELPNLRTAMAGLAAVADAAIVPGGETMATRAAAILARYCHKSPLA